MAMIVKNNLPGTKSLNQLNKNSKSLEKSLKKVASGMKINTAEDDASGYSVSERMQTQLRALEQDVQNTQNGSAMMKTAEGAVSNTVDILRTLKERVLNAANDTNTDWDRQVIQKELDQAVKQIDDNALVTYNGKYLIDGSKEAEMVETSSHWTNQALGETTNGETLVTGLTNRNGESLGIETSDRLTISWVKSGETKTVTIDPLAWIETRTDVYDNPAYDRRWNPNVPKTIEVVTQTPHAYTMDEIVDFMQGDMEIVDDKSKGRSYIGLGQDGKDVYTQDGKGALTLNTTKGGIAEQISGLSFQFQTSEGTLRKDANEIMTAFSQTINAQDPSEDNALALHVGAKANQATKLALADMGSVALGLKAPPPMFTTLNVSTLENASVAISVIDSALERALDQQTHIGAIQNRLEFTAANLVTASENTQASDSVIRDSDMAKEMSAYTRDNVLLQASQSMLAQANQNSSAVLSLLQ